MRVFISWSGSRSRAIADILRQWLPSVLQAVRPYFSPDDVTKGTRWSAEISKELDSSNIGLLILTPENQEAPWLLFEAGALAKNLDRSKVCPLLFGEMEPTDVKGPLVQFQSAMFSHEEMNRVLKMINNELGDGALEPGVLQNVFEMWWPKLEEQIKSALDGDDETEYKEHRTERDILEEVLALTRRLSAERSRRTLEFDHPVWEDLWMGIADVIRAARLRSSDDEMRKAMRHILSPLEYIMHRTSNKRPNSRLRRTLMELERLTALPVDITSNDETEDADESDGS